MINEYKFINGFPDNLEKRMGELSKEGWMIHELDMSQDIVRVLMVRPKTFAREASPPDHPSISSLG